MCYCSVKKSRKPRWVTTPAADPKVRSIYTRAGKYQPVMTRDYMWFARNALKMANRDAIRQAYESGREQIAASELASSPALFSLQMRFSRRYETVIADVGNSEARARNWRLRYRVEKNLLASVGGVEVSPLAQRYVSDRSAMRVAEISNQQQAALRRLFAFLLESNEPWARAVPIIESIVGLTERETGWVLNRRSAGENSDEFAARLLRKRAERIARTEIMDALAEGQISTWREAHQTGEIPIDTRKQWNTMDLGPRTSDICTDLADAVVPLNEQFQSAIVGPIDRPPAHPNCRSVLTLVF